MTRPLAWFTAALLAFAATAQAQPSGRTQGKDDSQKKERAVAAAARHQFHAAQAALYSALAHAAALDSLADSDETDMDLARSYVHTINREIQACAGNSVKIGQAKHSVEKDGNMKGLRKELTEAMKAIDESQNAVDGQGSLGPHAKNTLAHLQQAMISLVSLADSVGSKPLPAPGAQVITDYRSRQ